MKHVYITFIEERMEKVFRFQEDALRHCEMMSANYGGPREWNERQLCAGDLTRNGIGPFHTMADVVLWVERHEINQD